MPDEAQVLKLRSDPAELRLMRAFVCHWAGALGLSESDAFEACLVATEAVTNAIRHAGGEEPIDVTCRIEADDQLVIEVVDQGNFGATGPLAFEDPDPDDIGGRGLFLIQELTREFHLEKGKEGTRVSMVLGLTPAPLPEPVAA